MFSNLFRQNNSNNKPGTSSVKGFTLIELMVSIAIMAFIVGVALINHGKFNNTIALTNLSYEMALSIREAQVYGVSVRSFGSVTPTQYGVWFYGNPTQYILFADTNGNNVFDSGEAVETAQITQGNYISNFCAEKSGVSTCYGTLSGLSVLFKRPNPDAVVVGVSGGSPSLYESAKIEVSSKDGSKRCVSVLPTGQVSVQQVCN